MQADKFKNKLKQAGFAGEIYTELLRRTLYATDASIYREYPLAVTYPVDEKDVQVLITVCQKNSIPIIPRAAGTSLAGQCVGSGVVADVSRHMTKIVGFDKLKGIVRVQPGVIRDELNKYLKPFGWFFGPNTSTSNRCTIGGMTANNSSGSTSIKYGTTRDKLLAVRGVLSTGEVVEFSEGNHPDEIIHKIQQLLSERDLLEEIERNYPKKSIQRRNTGYALDIIADQLKSSKGLQGVNLAKLIAGSEGTLLFITEITLKLDPLPPQYSAVICAHFTSVKDSLKAARIAMAYEPYACELVDKIILDCTKENLEQRENRFFIQGDPEAILAIEVRADDKEALKLVAQRVVEHLQSEKLGYAYPVLYGEDSDKLWSLRAAGLGLLSNIPGSAKAIACIEDTAVDLNDLPEYIEEFDQMMETFGQQAVHYAHAGAGEIHLRPILNLRDERDFRLLRQISTSSAQLIKKYRGSLSGEHGDGRVRAEFIPTYFGEKIFNALVQVKKIFDPYNLLNPGKIIEAPPMDTSLREDPKTPLQQISTFFDYEKEGGFLAAAEKCNGSADCRKPFSSGGVMCPSYQATLDEKDSTRARANALREFVSGAANGQKGFAHMELKEVLDLCLACKGCTRECPSNVDMASMKSEWLYQYQKIHGRNMQTLFFGYFEKFAPIASALSGITNVLLNSSISAKWLKKLVGIANARSLPPFRHKTLRRQMKMLLSNNPTHPIKSVYFFVDEFTNYIEPEIGEKAISFLQYNGYEVRVVNHRGSGRALISKGLLPAARTNAETNVAIFSALLSENVPLIGIEPSAILTFRDEYPRLVRQSLKEKAQRTSKHTFTLDEFICNEINAGHITMTKRPKSKTIHLHGHCHQKALSTMRYTKQILQHFGYTVRLIPAGCCGMAGSFGFEEQHYELSMKIGELALFPYIRQLDDANDVLVATGTSCRHQILDGTGKKALHWIELLYFDQNYLQTKYH